MKDRNIQNGEYGWFEKGAMKKIESLPYKQQASCKLIYIALCSLSAKSRNSSKISGWKSQIASFASVSDKTVQRCLPFLKDLGILSFSPQDRKSNGKYDKLEIWLTNNTLTVGHFGDSTETAQRQQTPSTVRYINKEINKEINKLNTVDHLFENFWKIYPNKKSKQTAIKSWLKLSLEEKNLAIEKLPDHTNSLQWKKDAGQFVPHPSTWLNQKRWNDEITNLTPKIYAA